jgi:SAM-dependent methyltransferase
MRYSPRTRRADKTPELPSLPHIRQNPKGLAQYQGFVMLKIFTELKARRNQAVRAEFGHLLESCPEQYITHFCSVGGAAEHVRVLQKLLGSESQRVLVVGVFGGRDFWGLKVLGHSVTGLNLTDDPGCPGTHVGNVEDTWPFPDSSFDVVVAGEILEHLVNDYKALAEARRVLTPEGRLLITVPFLHDKPEYHIRVHTPRSIQRLLKYSGFRVDKYFERPGLPFKIYLNRLVTSLMLLALSVTGKTYFRPLLRLIGNWEYYWAERFGIIRSIAGKARISNWGCVICASKLDRLHSHLDINIETFQVRK